MQTGGESDKLGHTFCSLTASNGLFPTCVFVARSVGRCARQLSVVGLPTCHLWSSTPIPF